MALMNRLPNEQRATYPDGTPVDPNAVTGIAPKNWQQQLDAYKQNPSAYSMDFQPGGEVKVSMPGGASSGGAPQGINWQADPQTLTQQLTAYFASKGVPPTEVPYWVSKAPELVARGQELGNPNYGMERLNAADILGGGGTPQGSLQVGAGSMGGGATFGAFGGDPEAVMKMDPGYQFRLGEGLKGIERGAAARGTLLTGGTQKALERYGQDYASGEFGNIFNRNLSLAQLGENAAAGVGNFGANYAANAGNLLTQGGNAAAAGTVGSSNAWGGTLGDIANSAMLYYLMNKNQAGAQ